MIKTETRVMPKTLTTKLDGSGALLRYIIMEKKKKNIAVGVWIIRYMSWETMPRYARRLNIPMIMTSIMARINELMPVMNIFF